MTIYPKICSNHDARRLLYTHAYIYIYMMQGCHTPPPPRPPSPWYPPLPVKCSCLVWACCFSRLVLFGLVPSPLWSGTCGLFGWPAPLWGAVLFYRGMVWLLPLLSSSVIVTCLVPSPPCGACGRFGWPPPSLCGGSVFYRDRVWLLPLVSSNVIVTCSLPYKI